MFLGTVSMKPTMYRSASAIMVFLRGHGILMDCAEGSYGQLFDHFQSIEKVNEILLKMRLVFITHIHGDHQLGIVKIMYERDQLIEQAVLEGRHDPNNKLYIVTPNIMFEYLDQVRLSALKQPDMVVLVPSSDLNPETDQYYGEDEQYVKSRGQMPSDRKAVTKECPVRSYEEMLSIVDAFQP